MSGELWSYVACSCLCCVFEGYICVSIVFVLKCHVCCIPAMNADAAQQRLTH